MTRSDRPGHEPRFYGDLAAWWPLISPADDYAEEAAFAAALLRRASIPVRTVLELGSGGGHNAVHLAPSFTLTLTDLSASMIEVSRRLNPGCEHLVGDMRTLRLDRQFDAVFVHDAIEYMLTAGDLRRAMETAYVHCRPGGVAVFIPDAVTETFEPGADHGGEDGSDGRAVRFLEWTTDPDPDDTWTQTDYVFLLRGTDGSIDVVHEEHRTGLYPDAVWMDLLRDVGFDPELVIEATTEDRTPRHCFVAHRT